jgi:hypothetical protein
MASCLSHSAHSVSSHRPWGKTARRRPLRETRPSIQLSHYKAQHKVALMQAMCSSPEATTAWLDYTTYVHGAVLRLFSGTRQTTLLSTRSRYTGWSVLLQASQCIVRNAHVRTECEANTDFVYASLGMIKVFDLRVSGSHAYHTIIPPSKLQGKIKPQGRDYAYNAIVNDTRKYAATVSGGCILTPVYNHNATLTARTIDAIAKTRLSTVSPSPHLRQQIYTPASKVPFKASPSTASQIHTLTLCSHIPPSASQIQETSTFGPHTTLEAKH